AQRSRRPRFCRAPATSGSIGPGHIAPSPRWRAFRATSSRRRDLPLKLGGDLDGAVELVMSLGPGDGILRFAAERPAHPHKPGAEAPREGMAEWVGEDGVSAPASTWIVTASVPAQRRETS